MSNGKTGFLVKLIPIREPGEEYRLLAIRAKDYESAARRAEKKLKKETGEVWKHVRVFAVAEPKG